MRIVFLLLASLFSTALLAGEKSLASAAARADIVAVIQVEDTDYELRHGFPVSGTAVVHVLVAYKGAKRGETLTVQAKGLGAKYCYYPGRQNEGPRFLAFLHEVAPRKHSFDPRIVSGTKPDCALPVYVTAKAAYALRYPLDGFKVPKKMAHELIFADPYSFVEKRDLTQEHIAAIQSRYHTEDTGEQLHYTQGVLLSDIDPLMFPKQQ